MLSPCYTTLVNQSSSSKKQQYLLFLFHQNDIYLYILNIDAIGRDDCYITTVEHIFVYKRIGKIEVNIIIRYCERKYTELV